MFFDKIFHLFPPENCAAAHRPPHPVYPPVRPRFFQAYRSRYSPSSTTQEKASA